MYSWQKIGWQLADNWRYIGGQLADNWWKIGGQLAENRWTIGGHFLLSYLPRLRPAHPAIKTFHFILSSISNSFKLKFSMRFKNLSSLKLHLNEWSEKSIECRLTDTNILYFWREHTNNIQNVWNIKLDMERCFYAISKEVGGSKGESWATTPM